MKQVRKIYDKEFGEGGFPGKGNLKLTPEQEKIYELEKRLKYAELERDILKKAMNNYSRLKKCAKFYK